MLNLGLQNSMVLFAKNQGKVPQRRRRVGVKSELPIFLGLILLLILASQLSFACDGIEPSCSTARQHGFGNLQGDGVDIHASGDVFPTRNMAVDAFCAVAAQDFYFSNESACPASSRDATTMNGRQLKSCPDRVEPNGTGAFVYFTFTRKSDGCDNDYSEADSFSRGSLTSSLKCTTAPYIFGPTATANPDVGLCWRCSTADRSSKAPKFISNTDARWFQSEECPEDFGQQGSCLATGNSLAKYAVGNPIACRTGEKLKTEIDYSSAVGLSFTRHYSSMPQLGGAPSQLPQWFIADDITFSFIKKAAHGQIAELRFGDGGRLLFIGSGTATTLTSSTAAHGSLSNSTGSWVWSNSKGEKYGFGAGGKVATKTLKNGQVFSYGWQDDDAGVYRLTSVTEPFGRRVQVEYDMQGRMSAIIDPAGQRYRYGYDGNGNLITVAFPDDTPGFDDDNPVKTYLYENAVLPHHLTGIVDENSDRYSQYGYDSQGRATLSELGNHAEKVTMEYLETGNSLVQYHQDESTYRERLLVIDRSHGADRITRDEDFPCIDCNVGVIANEYDSNGFLNKTTDRNGVVTSYVRDASGRETSRTEGVGTAQQRTTTTSWSSINSQPYQIETGTRTLTHTYNSKGQLTQLADNDSATSTTRTTKYTYTTAGQLATVDGARTDATDVTSYSYDSQGNLLTVTNAKGQITTLSNYDAHGKVGTITDPNGLITTLTYTPRGWLKTRTVGGLTTTFDYDKVGQLKQVTMPDGSFVAYEYDAAHRLTAISNTLGERIEYTLDWAGNRTKEEVKAADGSVVLRRSKVFNALNQLLQDLNAANEVVASYAYDANGNLTGTSRFTDTGSTSSSYGYDPLNRLNAITDALNGATAFQYDGLDQLTQVTDPKTLVTQYGVDALGQLKQTTSPDTGVATQTFDSAGNVKTSSNARGLTTTYSYDALNRVTRIQYHDGVAVTFTYDDVSGGNYGIGRLTTVTDSSGSTAYRYDQFGRLLRKTQTIAGIALATQYGYDSYGRLATVTYPSGNLVGLRYNSAGQLTALSVNGVDRLSNLRYQPFGGIQGWNWSDGAAYNRSFDLDGRLSSYPLGGQTITLGYDRAGRLLSQTGGSNKQFDYDALDRLTGYTSAINQLFAYDANGNRLSFTEENPLTQDSAFSDYQVASSSNRLTGITGADARSYSYDSAGNTLSDGIRSYEYNTANRLSRVSKGSVVVDNSYNGLGQRVRKLVSGSQSSDTRYAYDEAGQLLGEYNADGSLINEMVYLGDMPVLLIRPAGIYNIQTDHLNTPRAITSSTQTVVWTWDSDAFGATLANEDPDNNGLMLQFNLRFPGQVYDAETGLHYNYWRTLDPSTGRYVESDPVGLKGGVNTYLYAYGKPLRFVDKLGLSPWECTYIVTRDRYRDILTYGADTVLWSVSMPDSVMPTGVSVSPGLSVENPYSLGITPEATTSVTWATYEFYKREGSTQEIFLEDRRNRCKRKVEGECGEEKIEVAEYDVPGVIIEMGPIHEVSYYAFRRAQDTTTVGPGIELPGPSIQGPYPPPRPRLPFR